MEHILSTHIMDILTNSNQKCLKTAFKISLILGKECLNLFIKKYTNKLKVGTIFYANERIYDDQDDQKNSHQFPRIPKIYKTIDGNIQYIDHPFTSWFRISKIKCSKYNKYSISCEYENIKREEIINFKDKQIIYKPNFKEISSPENYNESKIHIYSKYKKFENYPIDYKFNGSLILCSWHVHLDLSIINTQNDNSILYNFIEKNCEI